MNKRLLAVIPTGVMALSLIIGSGTYALFISSASNTGNTFSSGSISIQAERNDVPFEGPMFYTAATQQQLGGTPTGLWAPGVKNTRGLFLKNTGSLPAELSTLTASPADSSGNVVIAGSDFDNDMVFAQQAHVLIWQVQMYDPTNDKLLPFWEANMSSTDLNNAMYWINKGFKAYQESEPTPDLNNQQNAAALMALVNQDLLENINDLQVTYDGNTITNGTLKVVQLSYKPLVDLVQSSSDVSSMGVSIDPKQAALLAFTIDMDLQPPAGVDPNSMQGKSVYFNFGTDWTQK